MTIGWILLLGLGGLSSCLLVVVQQRWKRRRLVHQQLAQRRVQTLKPYHPIIIAGNGVELSPSFTANPIVQVHPFLSEHALSRAQAEAQANRSYAVRSYIPRHKKGGTLAYERLHTLAPHCLAIYHAEATRQWVSNVVGVGVYPTCDHDQSSCSMLYYDQSGDHIGWHFDHNFYKGRHFTVLLALLNTVVPSESSAGCLLYASQDGETEFLFTRPNTLVLFEGALIRHCAAPIGVGDLRVMLSMTYTTEPRIGWAHEVGRRIKDVAYFGPRALWD